METLIITGASRGIGAAVACLAAKNYAVVVNYARDEAAAADVVRQITSAGGRAFAIRADVSVEQDVGVYLRKLRGSWGRFVRW